MAFYSRSLVHDVEERVGIFYVDVKRRDAWNKSRPEGSLRLLTGWAFIERGGQHRIRGGFKSRSVAVREAYYAVLLGLDVSPGIETGPRLVKRRAA
jgi:hypothetical protein